MAAKSAEEILAALVKLHEYEIREALKALRTNDRYVLEDRQWECFYLVCDVAGMALDMDSTQVKQYLTMVTGQV